MGELKLLQNTTVNWFGNALQTLSWTDAAQSLDPDCAAHKQSPGSAVATTGVWIQGIGNGFEVTAPAKRSFQTLVVYVGLCCGTGHFTATLQPAGSLSTDAEDNEKFEIVLSHPDAQTNDQEGIIAITFRTPPGSKGKWVLRVTWVHVKDKDGNVTFQ